MKKIFMLLVVLIFICSVGCNSQKADNVQSATSAGQPKAQKDLSDEDLIKIVAEKLSVPDVGKTTYKIGEKTYWEAAAVYYKDITFYENGESVAGAAVNPVNGELLKNVYMYQK